MGCWCTINLQFCSERLVGGLLASGDGGRGEVAWHVCEGLCRVAMLLHSGMGRCGCTEESCLSRLR